MVAIGSNNYCGKSCSLSVQNDSECVTDHKLLLPHGPVCFAVSLIPKLQLTLGVYTLDSVVD